MDDTNVIDLMAALKRSLGQAPSQERLAAPAKRTTARSKEPVRNQPGLKLPIKGGKAVADIGEKPLVLQPNVPAAKPTRKRA